MKKLLSVTLVLAFVLAALSAIAPLTSAKSATISESEAKDLVEKAYQFCCDARVGDWNDKLVDYKSEDVCEIYVSRIDRTLTYRPVYESKLPGGSYSAMCETAKEIYTAEIAERAYWCSVAGHDLPMYHVAENGKVYGHGHSDYAPCYIHISIPSRAYSNNRGEGKIYLKILSGDSETATAIVSTEFYWADGPRSYYCEAVECKFENTSDGWRIADSELSVLLASSKTVLDEYRKANPEKVNPEVLKLIDAEAKYTVDDLVMELIVDTYCDYYKRYVDYVDREQKEINEIVKEITASDGSKRTMRYVEYTEINGFGIDNFAWAYLTDEFYEEFLTKAYHDNEFDMFITEGDTKYVAVIEGIDDLSYVYDPNEVVVRVIESTDKEATALVYCELKEKGKTIPIYVECKFEKGYERWYIAESDFVDMLTSADGFEYTVGEAPATGDSAFDTLILCLGGMVIVMSALCLVRRRREF